MKFFLIRCFIFGALLAQLIGCDSGLNGQIDKCVAAGLASNGPYKNSTEKAGDEITIRAFCMRAAAGKD